MSVETATPRFQIVTGKAADELLSYLPRVPLFSAYGGGVDTLLLYAASDNELVRDWLNPEALADYGAKAEAMITTAPNATGVTGLSEEAAAELANVHGVKAWPLGFVGSDGIARPIFPAAMSQPFGFQGLNSIDICANHPTDSTLKCNRADRCWYKRISGRYYKLQPPQACNCRF